MHIWYVTLCCESLALGSFKWERCCLWLEGGLLHHRTALLDPNTSIIKLQAHSCLAGSQNLKDIGINDVWIAKWTLNGLVFFGTFCYFLLFLLFYNLFVILCYFLYFCNFLLLFCTLVTCWYFLLYIFISFCIFCYFFVLLLSCVIFLFFFYLFLYICYFFAFFVLFCTFWNYFWKKNYLFFIWCYLMVLRLLQVTTYFKRLLQLTTG